MFFLPLEVLELGLLALLCRGAWITGRVGWCVALWTVFISAFRLFEAYGVHGEYGMAAIHIAIAAVWAYALFSVLLAFEEFSPPWFGSIALLLFLRYALPSLLAAGEASAQVS